MARLSISLLGPFQVAVDGVPVTAFESDKGRALLAYLAVEGDHPHRRDTLAGLLWPQRPDRSARHSLRQALSDLRRAIGDRKAEEPFLTVTRQTVQCAAAGEHWLDVQAFAAQAVGCGEHYFGQHGPCDRCLDLFQRAAVLYRGPFLQGFSLPGCSAFEEWCVVHREQFHLQTLDVLHRLVGELERRGALEEALGYARRQLELDPWREEAHRTVMRLLAGMGQRGAALAQYEICRRTLEEELGVEPEAGTTALYNRIRAGDQAARRPTPPNNLPAPVTPFVGREAQLVELGEKLQDPTCRLLTLLGPGGIGKTRLAREVAAAHLEHFPDGVFAVDLAALESPESIVPTVAQALSFSFSEGEEPSKQLQAYLRSKRMLLILDSFEHVLRGAGWVTETLRAAPDLKALVTSRSRLNLKGEHLCPVEGLNYPEEDSIQDAADYDAVSLFLQAALRVRSGWKPSQSELSGVARVCRMVEGMPLGILLAATWVEMLPPGEIADELGRGIDFLASDWQDVPSRHRSIRAVFDRSWDLLTEREQEVFQALSIFRGGFTQGAAEQVADASLREIQSLSDRSLINRVPGGRYYLHDLVRQYAAWRLEQLPEKRAALLDRHSAHYLQNLHRWGLQLKGTRQQSALTELDLEIENGRAAWDWAVESRAVTHLHQAMEGLCLYYDMRVRLQEGESASVLAVERFATTTSAESLQLRARAVAWAARFCRLQGDMERADELLQQGLGLLERREVEDWDTSGEGAFILYERGQRAAAVDRDEAKGLYERSLSQFKAVGDRWWTAKVQFALGALAHLVSAYEEAERWYGESLTAFRTLGDPSGTASALTWLGMNAFRRGRIDDGERLIREGVEIRQTIGDKAAGAFGLFRLGVALIWSGKPAESCDLLEECVPIFQELGLGYELAYSSMFVGLSAGNSGQYERARAASQYALVLCRQMGFRREAAIALWNLSGVSLQEKDYIEAEQLAQESVLLLRELGQTDELGMALTFLGCALRGLGQLAQARQVVAESLQIGAERLGHVVLSFALPAAVLLLADQGQVELAIETYSLASQFPIVWSSQWFEKVFERELEVAANTLSLDVVEAARQRGRERDLQATVAELLAELSE
jgi:predicted ATPase/DNA-binding SARP family transcriptional activator